MTLPKQNAHYNQSLPSVRRTKTHRGIERQIRTALQAMDAWNIGRTILVGVSGGMDSAVLLHQLAGLGRREGVRVVAAHVHHGVRGDEADRDAEVAEELARLHDCEFHVLRVRPSHKATGEQELRELRLAALDRLCTDLKANHVALAHHRDDQVETFLLRLLGGSDLRGLAGIRPFRAPRWIRPLLRIPRKELELEAESCGLPFVEDSTNRSTYARRNFVRKNLLPLLRAQFNPKIDVHLTALAESLARTSDFLESQADRLLSEAEVAPGIWKVAPLRAADPSLRAAALQLAFRKVAGEAGALRRVQLEVVEKMVAKEGRRRTYCLPRNVHVWREKGRVKFGKIN